MPPEIRSALAALKDYRPCISPDQAIADRQALDTVLAYLDRLANRIEVTVINDPHAIPALILPLARRCRNCGAPQ